MESQLECAAGSFLGQRGLQGSNSTHALVRHVWIKSSFSFEDNRVRPVVRYLTTSRAREVYRVAESQTEAEVRSVGS